MYVGTNYDDVNEGTSETFQGNQETTSLIIGLAGFLYPDGLTFNTNYYWRVDEVLSDGTKQRGNVWSFWIPPLTAHTPVPADGEPVEPVDIDLNWSLGSNTTETARI